MNSSHRYQLGEAISLTEIDGEMVLLELTSGQYYGLNDTGTKMLKCLIDGNSIDECGESLATQYNISSTQLRTDMKELLADLLEHQLLVRLD